VIDTVVPAPAGYRWCSVFVSADGAIDVALRAVPAFGLCVPDDGRGVPVAEARLLPFIIDPNVPHAAVLASPPEDPDTESGFLVDPCWLDSDLCALVEETVQRLRTRRPVRSAGPCGAAAPAQGQEAH
jgi:hypothetical protein